MGFDQLDQIIGSLAFTAFCRPTHRSDGSLLWWPRPPCRSQRQFTCRSRTRATGC